MPKALSTLVLFVLALLAAATSSAGAAVVPSLGARLVGCEDGLAPEQRAADFSGSMPAVDGASVLAMRFELEQRRGSTWKAAPIPGTRWESSVPGAAGFVYAKRVERLAPGASYRMLVRFRWTAADGTVVRRTARRSATCREDDLRPDLSVAAITAAALPDGRTRYVVSLRNDGPTAVLETVPVGLAVDGVAQPPRSLPGLAPSATRTLELEGPACRPGGTLRAVVDPEGAIDESDEADNAVVVRCPGA